MKLHDAKIIRGSMAGTRMEWFCGEFESFPFPPGSKKGSEYIGCVDLTVPSHARSIFFINKDQPPETFDFHKDAYSSYEQIAMAQIVVMGWGKLKDGDKITLNDELEEKIRELNGSIWTGGSESTIKQVAPGVSRIKIKDVDRDLNLDDPLIYNVENKEY